MNVNECKSLKYNKKTKFRERQERKIVCFVCTKGTQIVFDFIPNESCKVSLLLLPCGQDGD